MASIQTIYIEFLKDFLLLLYTKALMIQRDDIGICVWQAIIDKLFVRFSCISFVNCNHIIIISARFPKPTFLLFGLEMDCVVYCIIIL